MDFCQHRKPYKHDQRDSVKDMLESLQWESLESRRIKADHTMTQIVANPHSTAQLLSHIVPDPSTVHSPSTSDIVMAHPMESLYTLTEGILYSMIMVFHKVIIVIP